jgi:sortase (surface protein transpeptidase)
MRDRGRHRVPGDLRRAALVIGALAAVVLASGLALGAHFAAAGAPRLAAGSSEAGDAGKLQDPVTDAAPAKLPAVTATRVRMPSIGVDTKLIGLDLKPGTDQLKAPLDFAVAGWYEHGTVPGDVGPAVIDGHVDSPTAPGVFLHLAKLRPGDRIEVTLSNAQVKTFAVTKTLAAPKTHFPTRAVYGPTPAPELRVITCDGIFDKATGHYLDNLVVFATLVG